MLSYLFLSEYTKVQVITIYPDAQDKQAVTKNALLEEML